MIEKIIKNINAGVPIKCKEYVRAWRSVTSDQDATLQKMLLDPKSSEASKTTTKNSKKKEKKENGGPLSIIISGETFFTNPELSIHRLTKPDREIFDGYILLTVNNLMTRQQKNEMNPLVITTKKIIKLPVNILQKHG